MPVYSWEKTGRAREQGGRVHIRGKPVPQVLVGEVWPGVREQGGRARWGNKGARFSRD